MPVHRKQGIADAADLPANLAAEFQRYIELDRSPPEPNRWVSVPEHRLDVVVRALRAVSPGTRGGDGSVNADGAKGIAYDMEGFADASDACAANPALRERFYDFARRVRSLAGSDGRPHAGSDATPADEPGLLRAASESPYLKENYPNVALDLDSYACEIEDARATAAEEPK